VCEFGLQRPLGGGPRSADRGNKPGATVKVAVPGAGLHLAVRQVDEADLAERPDGQRTRSQLTSILIRFR
jgi:hypothetical protein